MGMVKFIPQQLLRLRKSVLCSVGHCVDLRAGLVTVEKRNNLLHLPLDQDVQFAVA